MNNLASKRFTNHNLSAVICSVILLCIFANRSILIAQTPDSGDFDPGKVGRLIAEIGRATSVDMSPDGRAVVYTKGRPSVETNDVQAELVLQGLDAGGAASGPPTTIAEKRGEFVESISFSSAWRPDGKAISFLLPPQKGERASGQFVVYEVATGSVTPIPVKDVDNPVQTVGTGTGQPRPRITSFGRDYQWSPSGKYIAFGSGIQKTNRLDKRNGQVQTPALEWRSRSPVGILFVLEVGTGQVTQITGESISVGDFAWSPDESEFAITTATDDAPVVASVSRGSSLLIVDRQRGVSRVLYSGPGRLAAPSFSPDGKQIAFSTETPDTLGSRILRPSIIYTNNPKSLSEIAVGEGPSPDYHSESVWSADGRSFYYTSPHHMARELALADTVGKRVSLVHAEDNYSDTRFSFSMDRRRVAFIRSSNAEPGEVYVKDLLSGKARKITSLGASFPLRDRVRIDRVEWRSPDKKFTVHGILLTPQDVWNSQSSRPRRPLPTVVYNHPGPGMVQSAFGVEGQGGIGLALAARGYAVLYPNTRGRNGYGEEFERAMRVPGGFYRIPFEEVMSGIDMLIEKGIADPKQLGVGGQSYGANLTTWLLTQTNRFRAAVIHEATHIHLLADGETLPRSRAEEFEIRYGTRDSSGSTSLKNIIDQSAYFHIANMKTPALLQFGSNAGRAGEPLFAGLTRLKVPVEFVVYDMGHAVGRPSQIQDDLQRVGMWFDFWLRDMPYPDKAREKEWNAWRAAQGQKNNATLSKKTDSRTHQK